MLGLAVALTVDDIRGMNEQPQRFLEELVCTVSPEVAEKFEIVAGARAVANLEGRLQPFRWIISPYLQPGQIGGLVRLRRAIEK